MEDVMNDVAPELTDAEIDVRTATAESTPPEPEPEQEPEGEPEAPPPPEPETVESVKAKLKAAEREQGRLRQQADYWMTNYQRDFQAKQQIKPDAPAPEPDDPNAPKAGNFETYDKYLVALTRYETAKAVEQVNQQRQQEALKSFVDQKTAEATTKYPDFAAVAFSDDAVITTVMAQAMLDSPYYADMAYWMGKNPEESRKIAALAPMAQVRIIGQLEGRFASAQADGNGRPPAPAPVTRAPAPPSTTVGGGQAAARPLEKLSIDDFMRVRNKQERERR